MCKHACMPAHACAPSAPGTPKTRLPTNNAINPQDQVCPAPGAQRPATPCRSFREQVGPPESMPRRLLLATTALGASLPAEGANDGTRALPVLLGKPLAFMPSFTHSLVLRTLPEHLDPTRLSPDTWAASTHSERPGEALPHGARLPGHGTGARAHTLAPSLTSAVTSDPLRDLPKPRQGDKWAESPVCPHGCNED